MVAGFSPVFSPHNLLVLLLALILRVNLSAFILGFVVFSGLSFGLDPVFHRAGLAVLTAGSLEGLWTMLYNSTPWRLERFYNSVVIGSLLFSLVLFAPMFVLFKNLILKYREHVLAWIEKTRLMQMFRASKIFKVYQTLSGWGRAS